MSSRGLRWTAVGIGVLFWISDLVTLIGGVVTGTLPTSANALATVPAHATQIVAGTLIAHVNDFAVIGYGVLLYTVLVRFNAGAALGVAAFKVVEAVLLLIAAAMLLALVGLAQSGPDPTTFKASADLALSVQFWTTRLAAFAYLVSTPLANLVLFQTRLVPRWLSGFGLVACAMLATGLALGVGDPTRGFEPGQLLLIPIILWELTFATWLIARGFNPTPTARQTDLIMAA